MFLAGIDLAWTDHRESGVCILEARGEEAALSRLEARTDTVAGFVEELTSLGPDVVVAVDAPLIRREGCMAERRLGTVFGGKYKASAYLATTAFLESRRPPLDAGLRLGVALAAAGFELDPLRLAPGARGRFAFEMYPHAFHVAEFGLPERLAYKKGRRAARLRGFAEYQDRLRQLADSLAPGLAASGAIAATLDPAALAVRGRGLKALEDRLDALTCALAALIAWRVGIVADDVFGDAAEGYIAVPGLHRTPFFMARRRTG
jgi:predicted RNase H-like nuclease